MAAPAPPPLDRPLRIAICHYHLRPGGVTRVIEHCFNALTQQNQANLVILSGEPYEGDVLTNVRVVPQLAYGGEDSLQSAVQLADRLRGEAMEGLGNHPPDIWHFHNHALGKHAFLADATAALAESGVPLLLQIHDFAEDGRPSNYKILKKADTPYPVGVNVHYAVLNSRDQVILSNAGIPIERVHYLPNPAPPVPGRMIDGLEVREKPLALYPCRGIRRKNLGEICLLSALLGDRAVFATTRRPDNPQWQPIHDRWEAMAKELELHVHFGVVDELSPADVGYERHSEKSFKAWMDAADIIITTSIAEGFGLAFLEPLMSGHLLLGRDLPEITEDLKETGLPLTGLYKSLRVPLSWIGEEKMLESLDQHLLLHHGSYDRKLPKYAAEQTLTSMTDARGRVDFGRLNEKDQEVIIRKVIDEDLGEQVIVETDGACAGSGLWLDSWFDPDAPRPDFQSLRPILTSEYSLNSYAERLTSYYTLVLNSQESSHSEPDPQEISKRLMDSFLQPERFSFLLS